MYQDVVEDLYDNAHIAGLICIMMAVPVWKLDDQRQRY
jgi:hypothetical protein